MMLKMIMPILKRRYMLTMMLSVLEWLFKILIFSVFSLQVEATFLRAVHENVKEDHIILEVNSLRYDAAFSPSFSS